MNPVLDIIKNETLTYSQQLYQLAAQAENSIEVLNIDEETKELLQNGLLCDLFEGNAPYRPRYIVPNYMKVIKEGCKFLELTPATDIWEATHNLLIFYKHVPSITSFPVYLGDIDALLNEFVVNEDEAYKAIKLFLHHIDKTLTNSFVHANIGPVDTKAGRLILKAMEELQCSVPNLTVKVQEGVTTDEFLALCSHTALVTAKPSFVNHDMNSKNFGTDQYAIVSCYNGFIIGGGGHTLARVILDKVAKESTSIEDFMENKLPYVSEKLLKLIDIRTKFLVEESPFFKTNFLVKEGFLSQDLFTGMFGLVGLAEAVNHLLGATEQKDRFGYSEKADKLGLEIIKKLDEIVKAHKCEHVTCFDGRHVLHAQVGMDADVGTSPGCRIPVGEEPELFKHIVQSAPFHKYFFNGIGDIFVFEDTYTEKPEAIVDVVKGAFNVGLRYISVYGQGSDIIRVTGYMAKKSEIEKLERGEVVLNGAEVFAMGAKHNCKSQDRRLRG